MGAKAYSTLEVRVRAVRALAGELGVGDVATAYQVDRVTVWRWKRRYEHGGDAALERRPTSGRPRMLQQISEKQLMSVVLAPATKFGYETDLWTCRRVRDVLRDKYKIDASRWTIWRRLRDADLTYKKPERAYLEASEAARQEWVEKDVPAILETVRRHRAILYFEDEAHVSLTAFLGKTWGPRGTRTKVRVTGKRGGIAAISAITRRGGLLFRLMDKRINSGDIIRFLSHMLKHHKRRHLVVVMDQAPPHTSRKTKAYIAEQKRLHVFYLPSRSPDWNPDEKVWNHLKHHELKAHRARTTEELKRLARKKLRGMARRPRQLRGIFFRCCIAELLH